MLEGRCPAIWSRHAAGAPEDAWISTLEKPARAPLEASCRSPRLVRTPGPGDRVPDTTFARSGRPPLSLAWTGGHGRRRHFHLYAVPAPQFCPMLDRRFARYSEIARRRRQGSRAEHGCSRSASTPSTDTCRRTEGAREEARSRSGGLAVRDGAARHRRSRFAAASASMSVREAARPIIDTTCGPSSSDPTAASSEC